MSNANSNNIELFPISLKMKTAADLVKELQSKKITLLIDARRKPIHRMNSRVGKTSNNNFSNFFILKKRFHSGKFPERTSKGQYFLFA